MKYFTLTEVLISFPVMLIFGSVAALIRGIIKEICLCTSSFFDLPRYIRAKNEKIAYKFRAEGPSKKLCFVLTEIGEAIFFVLAGLTFTVINYVLSDGIPRLYILLLFILFFAVITRILRKPLSLISKLFAATVTRAVFFLIFLIVFLPLRLKKHLNFSKREKFTPKIP